MVNVARARILSEYTRSIQLRPVSLDGQQTANTLFVKMLDQIYVLSPLR